MRALHRSTIPLAATLLLTAATTANAGWELRSTNYDILIGIDFKTAETGWTVGALNGVGPVIKRTDDGGVNWDYQSTDMYNMYWMDVDMADLKYGWCNGLVAFIGKQSVNHTSNGGKTWEGQVKKYNIAAWLDMFSIDSEHAWSSGMWTYLLQAHEGLMRTTDGGETWKSHDWNKPEPARFIHFVDANHGWMSGGHWPEGSVAAGGVRVWKPTQHFPASWPIPDAMPQRPHDEDQTYGCLIGRTSDGGKTFDTIFTSGAYYPNHIFFVDRNEGWFVAEGYSGTRIMHTTDGGVTWTQQVHDLQAELISLADIYMFNRREGWAVGFSSTAFGNPKTRFLHTMNGGETWEADPFTSNVGPMHMSWVDESTGFTVGTNNNNVSKVLGYSEPARAPKLHIDALNTPDTAGGSDVIHWDISVENRTSSPQTVDAWLQISGPNIPGYTSDSVLRTGIVVPPNYRGIHRITFELPGLPVGIYGIETLLGPAHNIDPLQIKAYDTFSVEVTH